MPEKFVHVVFLLALSGAGASFAQDPNILVPKDGLVILLVNKNSGRCLTVAGGAVDPGVKIVQGPFPNQAGPSEYWTLMGTDKGFRLRNEKSGLMMQIPLGNRKFRGTEPTQAADKVTKENQHWTFEAADGAFIMHAGNSEFVLGVAEGSRKEAAVIQWNPLPNQKDQLWTLRSTKVAAADDQRTVALEIDDTLHSWKVPAILIGGLVLLLAVGIGMWVARRHRLVHPRQESSPDSAEKLDPPEESGSVIVTCPACGERFRSQRHPGSS